MTNSDKRQENDRIIIDYIYKISSGAACRIQRKEFDNIHDNELVLQRTAPNLYRMGVNFTNLANYVIERILSKHNPNVSADKNQKALAKEIIRWIEIMDRLKKEKLDYHSAGAINSAFHNLVINRLKETWKKVPQDKKDILDEYTKLFHHNNYGILRSTMKHDACRAISEGKALPIPYYPAIKTHLLRFQNVNKNLAEKKLKKNRGIGYGTLLFGCLGILAGIILCLTPTFGIGQALGAWLIAKKVGVIAAAIIIPLVSGTVAGTAGAIGGRAIDTRVNSYLENKIKKYEERNKVQHEGFKANTWLHRPQEVQVPIIDFPASQVTDKQQVEFSKYCEPKTSSTRLVAAKHMLNHKVATQNTTPTNIKPTDSKAIIAAHSSEPPSLTIARKTLSR